MLSRRLLKHSIRLPISRYQHIHNDYRVIDIGRGPAFSTVCSSSDDDKAVKTELGLFDRTFGKQSCEAAPSFKNRWLMAVPAFATHMYISMTLYEHQVYPHPA